MSPHQPARAAAAHPGISDDDSLAIATCSERADPAAARVLIIADDAERAAAQRGRFAEQGYVVRTAVGASDGRRLLHLFRPGIVVATAVRHSPGLDEAIALVTQDGSARVMLVITDDARGRTLIEVLRRGLREYTRTSSVSLAANAVNHPLWTWIGALSHTLHLELEMRHDHTPPVTDPA